MIHGLDTGFLVAAEVAEHADHGAARHDPPTKPSRNSSHSTESRQVRRATANLADALRAAPGDPSFDPEALVESLKSRQTECQNHP
jgi:hypothetical protein